MDFESKNLVEKKPRFRGWSHGFTFFLSLVSGVWLWHEATHEGNGVVVGIFVVSITALYMVSGMYHFFNWSPKAERIIKRIDHALIFVLISGTYTPILWISLPRGLALNMLFLVWILAGLGVYFKLFGIKLKRFISVGMYVVLGWIAVFVLSDLMVALPSIAMILIFAGGVSYSIGAVCYGLKKPNPFPLNFGYHEVFHVLVILGSVSHFIAIAIINKI